MDSARIGAGQSVPIVVREPPFSFGRTSTGPLYGKYSCCQVMNERMAKILSS
jgi:hypothetical protein